jgi:hypothetical protein
VNATVAEIAGISKRLLENHRTLQEAAERTEVPDSNPPLEQFDWIDGARCAPMIRVDGKSPTVVQFARDTR